MGGGSDIFDMGAGGVIPAMFNEKTNPAGTGGTPGVEGLFSGGAWSPGAGAPGPTPTPPASTPGGFAGVPTRQLPGFSGPGGRVPLFGQLSPEQLAAYNGAHGINLPRPPAGPGQAKLPLPVAAQQKSRSRSDPTREGG